MEGQTRHSKWAVLVLIWLLAALGLGFQDRESMQQWLEVSNPLQSIHFHVCSPKSNMASSIGWKELSITQFQIEKRLYSKYLSNWQIAARDTCWTYTLSPATDHLFHFTNLLEINSSCTDFSELSYLFHEHACASLLATFRKSRAHNLEHWDEIIKQSIFMQSIFVLFCGRSPGTISVLRYPPTSLFRWRPCCKRPQASAVSDLKGIDLGRQSRPGDLAIKLVIANKYY